LAERIPQAAPVSERRENGDATRVILHKLLFWHPGSHPVVLEAIGMWNASRGDTGDADAHRVVMRAVAESGRFAYPGPGFDRSAKAWLNKHRDELEELRRCWRVEAARADLAALWEAIDNDAPNTVFTEQYERWSDASMGAAEAAVAGWLGEAGKAAGSTGNLPKEAP
jgi:hypothetical protein